MNKKIMVCLCLLSVSLMMLFIGCKPSDELPPGPEDMESTSQSAPLGLATGYQTGTGTPAECYPDSKARSASGVADALTITSSTDDPTTTEVIEVNANDLVHVNVRIKDNDLVWVPVKVGKGTDTGRKWETLALVDPTTGSTLNFHSKNKYGAAGCVSTHIGETCTDTCQDGLQCRGQEGNKKCFPRSGTQCWAAAGSNDVTLPLSAFNIQPSDFRDCTLQGAPNNPVQAVVLAGYTGAAASGKKWLVQVITKTVSGTGGGSVGLGGQCQQTSDCQSGLECSSGTCQQPQAHCGDTDTKCSNGEGCRSSNDCQSGVCENGLCTASLTQEAPEEFDIDDMSSGGTGGTGGGTGGGGGGTGGGTLKADGQPCSGNTECQNNNCLNGACAPAGQTDGGTGGGSGCTENQCKDTTTLKMCSNGNFVEQPCPVNMPKCDSTTKACVECLANIDCDLGSCEQGVCVI